MHYNTTNETGEVLKEFTKKAESQDEKILKLFKFFKVREFSPSEVLNSLFTSSTPITSVRRSMTNLTNAGKLECTGKKVIGMYGRPENRWRLKIACVNPMTGEKL